MNLCYTTMAAPAPEQERQRRGRRKHSRSRLVYRLVRVEYDGDEGLARCRNISDGGLKLDLSMPVKPGARIRVAFSTRHVFTGKIIWARDGECGVALDAQIDSYSVLRDSAAETRARGCPELQLNRELPATLRCNGRVRRTRVSEVTQNGLRIEHQGDVYPQAVLSIALGADRERQGIVRWSDDRFAEVILLDPFSVAELGSLEMLNTLKAGNDDTVMPQRRMIAV